MRNPFFSVVIPTYNREELIERVLNSVLKQTFTDFEIIIVDNCSTDKTVSIIQGIQKDHPIINLICNSENLERCISRNIGIHQSKGEYICFLDSDDFWLENHLSELHTKIIKTDKVGLYFTNAYNSDDFETLTDRICPDLDNFSVFDYLLTYTFNPSRVAVHHKVLEEFEFDPEIPGLEDFDLWLRIATKFPIFQLNKRTVVYNSHSESTSSTTLKNSNIEIKLYQTVFSKETLKKSLPKESKNRLMSMCYYHKVLSLNSGFYPFLIHYYIFKAFFLCPEGYNINSNKTMFVIFIDQFPIIGYLSRFIRGIIRK